MDKQNPEKAFAFIAGGSGGFGQTAVNVLADRGYTVFAGDISVNETRREGDIHYLNIDVTSDKSVNACIDYIKQFTDRLDIVASFAGVTEIGSLVEQDAAHMQRILDINVVGMYRVNRAAFPLVKNAKGRYINTSSEYAVLDAIPFNAYYTTSKHAVKIYNNGLRREMLNWDVKVVELRPGAYKTSMVEGVPAQFEKMLAQTELYKPQFTKMKNMMTAELANAKSADKFAKTFEKAAFAKRPKLVYAPNNSFKMKLLKLLPARMLDKVFHKIMK